MARTVLLITNTNDGDHTDKVEAGIRARGWEAVRLNTDRLATEITVSYRFVNGSKSIIGIHTANKMVDLAVVTNVWYRRPEPPTLTISNEAQREFAIGEYEEFLNNLWFILRDRFWVNDFLALVRARPKLPQLDVASSLGFKVPQTCVTNNPKVFREFYEQHRQLIYKTLRRPYIGTRERIEYSVPTSRIEEKHLSDIERLLPNAPGFFQEYIQKQYEVRVTIIGNQVFAAKIESAAGPVPVTDWRSGVARGTIEVSSFQVPTLIEEQCRKFLNYYNLRFGAIDLICNPEGEYVFLENNPNGQWFWIEHLTRQPLTDSMCELLTSPRRR